MYLSVGSIIHNHQFTMDKALLTISYMNVVDAIVH